MSHILFKILMGLTVLYSMLHDDRRRMPPIGDCYSRRASSRSVSQEAERPDFKNVRNKWCRACTRDEIRSLRPRWRRKAISDTAVGTACVCLCVRAPHLVLRFGSHSAIRYPPVDASTLARPFSTRCVAYLQKRSFFSFFLFFFLFLFLFSFFFSSLGFR
jgi:hypothetical protein